MTARLRTLCLLLCLPVAFANAHAGPAAAPNDSQARVHAEITRLASTIDGVVGLAAWTLDDTSHVVGLNTDRAFPMASTYKVAIAAAVLARVDRGELALTTLVPVPRSLYVASDIIASRFPHEGVALSIHNLLELMLTQSDNTATDVLMAQAGGPEAVTAWLRGQGIDGQRVDRDTAHLLRDFFGLDDGPMEASFAAAVARDPALPARGGLPYAPFDDDPRDTSTPAAMAALLTRLFAGEALSPSSTEVLASIMARCRTCDARLRGRLPPGTQVADKSGTVGGTVNAVGVVTLPDARQMVVAAFVMRSAAPVAERERVIAEITRTVRDYFLLHGSAR